jgi:hypothetical protein
VCGLSLFRLRILALHSCTPSYAMLTWDAMPKVERASAKRPSLRIHLKAPEVFLS